MNTSIARRQALGGAAAVGALAVVGVATAGSAEAATRPTVQYGSRGSSVTYLQQRLNAVGYWCGAADGVFGGQTQQAVFALQKAWSLVRDGIVGPLTWTRVASNTRRPARYGYGHRIEIDKSRQLLLVVWGSTVRYTLNTSTGANKPFYAWGRWYDGRTPSGKFTVRSHVNGWQTGALGSMYKPYYFNGGIAVHGSTSVPTYNASHGCCRLSLAAQDKLIGSGYLVNGRQVYVY
ncbi:peptidoglycan-binding protein [Flexivirga endophytica]|uniref:Peptidoglycan-binding protein n=1 Tax=Flexivirga endophytica TaxID=1849103 RepID=A0A916TH37_9MICO|nr:peptidoglycan-binding protein [Flexivirga endophytica]GGB45213.1 peptidoglycan-binding protein [Flexivirga endophytica]GHB66767.1 peptidoglycan-binding protein [Flexivirga endophytica]